MNGLRKFKRKKGSSLVMVVFITAIIFTTATSMIAVVTTDYKHRINQSKTLQNQYQSEAGMDIAKNVIIKNSDAAIVYANAKVKEHIVSLDPTFVTGATDNEVYIELNEVFKDSFIEFLYNNTDITNNNLTSNSNLSIDGNYIAGRPVINENTNDKLIYGILNNRYAEITDNTIESSKREKISGYNWQEISRVHTGKQDYNIEILSYEVNRNNWKITVKIKSTFNTVNSNDGLKNEKSISTKYTIEAPNYTRGITTNSTPVEVNQYSIQKAIVADGDLTASSGITNVTGDVLVKGTDVDFTGGNYAYNKYNTGIIINNSTFNVTGNVYTSNTFNVQNRAHSLVTGNLYALNAYVGLIGTQSAINQVATNSSLDVDGEVVTNNDLALNATHSTIDIADYYGVGSMTEGSSGRIFTSEDQAKNSSSIILNEKEESIITIGNAYVSGIAYMDVGNGTKKYATGESIGIKGNHIAYTDKVPGSDREVKFDLYSPLLLATAYIAENGDVQNMTLEQKAAYFTNYFNNNSNSNILISDGLSIGTLRAIGAFPTTVITNSTATAVADSGSLTIETINEVIEPYQELFAEQVYCMGSLIQSSTTNYVASTVYEGNSAVKTVSNQIGYNPITDNGFDTIQGRYISPNNVTDLPEVHGKFIYCKNNEIIRIDNDRIVILASDGTEIEHVNAQVNSGGNYHEAIVITNGDVQINDGVNFTGSIIAGGDVTINGNVTITYDEQTVQGITAKYARAVNMEEIFTGAPLNGNTPIIIKIESELQSDTSTNDEKYDATEYLVEGIWKLVK